MTGRDRIEILAAFLIKKIHQTKVGRFLFELVIKDAMSSVAEISHGGNKFIFSTPNNLSRQRVLSFATKEPETLEWIDNIQQGSVLWDIGANIGLYSIYAARAKKSLVWSFEPSVFNLEMLSRNIYLNSLADRICIVPLPLSDKLGVGKMHLTSTEWGGALSTFEQDFGWDGNALPTVFEYNTIGVSMEEAIRDLAIPKPDYIKLDVDGLEHFILRGGISVLQDVKEKYVLWACAAAGG